MNQNDYVYPGLTRTCCVAAALFFSCGAAQATERGWLKFADGNVVAGELLEATETTGVFRSDRFGTFEYAAAEAEFRLEPGEAQAAADDEASKPGWMPDSWSVTGGLLKQSEDERSESRFEIDLSTTWVREPDEVRLTLRADRRNRTDGTDLNEHSSRLRWFHEISQPWFLFVQGYTERDTIELDQRFDFQLLQGAVGGGIRHHWTPRAYTRFALAFNRFSVEALDFDATAYENANSAVIESRFPLSERIALTQWITWYDWQDGGTGLESETDLGFAVTDFLSLGLRHRYRDSGATLQSENLNELRFFTRVTF